MLGECGWRSECSPVADTHTPSFSFSPRWVSPSPPSRSLLPAVHVPTSHLAHSTLHAPPSPSTHPPRTLLSPRRGGAREHRWSEWIPRLRPPLLRMRRRRRLAGWPCVSPLRRLSVHPAPSPSPSPPLLPSSASPAPSRRRMSAPLPAPCMADKPWRIHHAFQTVTNGSSFSFARRLHWPACDSFRWLNVPSDYISACVLMIITPFLSELTASPSD